MGPKTFVCISDGLWFLNDTPINKDIAEKFIIESNYCVDPSFKFDCLKTELNKIYLQYSRIVCKRNDNDGIVPLTDKELEEIQEKIQKVMNPGQKDQKIKELLIKTFDGSLPCKRGTLFLCTNKDAFCEIDSEGNMIHGSFVAHIK